MRPHACTRDRVTGAAEWCAAARARPSSTLLLFGAGAISASDLANDDERARKMKRRGHEKDDGHTDGRTDTQIDQTKTLYGLTQLALPPKVGPTRIDVAFFDPHLTWRVRNHSALQ